MNFGCQAEVFQIPHHRQYLFVTCYAFGAAFSSKYLTGHCWFLYFREVAKQQNIHLDFIILY